VVICPELGADLHMAQLMPLPLTVSCFSKIQIGFTFLVQAHLCSPDKGSLNVCMCCGMKSWASDCCYQEARVRLPDDSGQVVHTFIPRSPRNQHDLQPGR